MLDYKENPLCRWVIGPTHSRGLDMLRLSIQQMHKLYPQFDLEVCFNQIPGHIIWDKVGDLPVTFHKQKGDELGIQPTHNNVKKGVNWKLYPARRRIHTHEIIMDNDLILFNKVLEIDKFLDSNRSIILQAYNRNYGQFDDHVRPDLSVNTGMYGMPPKYNFGSKINELLKNRTWQDRGDEQGIVATCLQDLDPIVVSYNVIAPMDNYAKFRYAKGVHFIHGNAAEFHKAWKQHQSLGIFVVADPGREKHIEIQSKHLDHVAPGVKRYLICDSKSMSHPKYETHVLKRRQQIFSFQDAITAGFDMVDRPIIVYMDCDRLPETEFFIRARHIEDKQLFACKRLYDIPNERATQKQWEPDFRINDVSLSFTKNKKNVMSGCVAIKKESFKSLKLDRSFVGCGFADYDIAMTAQKAGFKTTLTDLSELHLEHAIGYPDKLFKLLNAWGGIRFCNKWGIEIGQNLKRLSAETGFSISQLSDYNLDYLIDQP